MPSATVFWLRLTWLQSWLEFSWQRELTQTSQILWASYPQSSFQPFPLESSLTKRFGVLTITTHNPVMGQVWRVETRGCSKGHRKAKWGRVHERFERKTWKDAKTDYISGRRWTARCFWVHEKEHRADRWFAQDTTDRYDATPSYARYLWNAWQ